MRDILGKNFYGSFWGRFGRGSGEAHSVSDDKYFFACRGRIGFSDGAVLADETL